MNITFIVLNIAAEILLIFCGAFFAATETSYTSLSKITVRQMLKDNEKNAKLISKHRNNLDSLITTVLIGTNLVTTLISALATSFSMNVFGEEYVSYGTALISILVIIFVEIVPKTFAAYKPKQMAKFSAKPIYIIKIIFFPLVWIFSKITKFIEFIEKVMFKKKKPLVTEDELITLLDLGEHEGTLEKDERRMLEKICEFGDITCHEMMKHRSFVKYINVHSNIDQVIQIFAECGFSRIPVYEDNEENIIGVLHYKSVLFAMEETVNSYDFIRKCMRPVMFVPESFSATDLLSKFKREKDNFAVVVNEYGGMEGIVTMDDILRTVFGRITDEYGSSEISPEERITIVGTNEFILPGDMKTDDVHDVLKINVESDNYDTLGGYLLEKFDELPSIGAVYKNKDCIFIVEDVSNHRIQSVRIKFME